MMHGNNRSKRSASSLDNFPKENLHTRTLSFMPSSFYDQPHCQNYDKWRQEKINQCSSTQKYSHSNIPQIGRKQRNVEDVLKSCKQILGDRFNSSHHYRHQLKESPSYLQTKNTKSYSSLQRKYDYLGENNYLHGQKLYEWGNNGIVINPASKKDYNLSRTHTNLSLVRNINKQDQVSLKTTKILQNQKPSINFTNNPEYLRKYPRNLKLKEEEIVAPQNIQNQSPVKRLNPETINQFKNFVRSPNSFTKGAFFQADLKNYKKNMVYQNSGKEEDISDERIDRIHNRINQVLAKKNIY